MSEALPIWIDAYESIFVGIPLPREDWKKYCSYGIKNYPRWNSLEIQREK